MGMEKNMSARILHKHDIEANWNKALNFIPKAGEIIIYDIDENHSYSRFKIGDGIRTISNLEFSLTDLTGYATESYVNSAVASLVNTAPEALNTLNELAAALGDDPNFATTVATEIGKKIDKVDGKGLSTNDFTNTYKEKLDGLNKPLIINFDNNSADKTFAEVKIAYDNGILLQGLYDNVILSLQSVSDNSFTFYAIADEGLASYVAYLMPDTAFVERIYLPEFIVDEISQQIEFYSIFLPLNENEKILILEDFSDDSLPLPTEGTIPIFLAYTEESYDLIPFYFVSTNRFETLTNPKKVLYVDEDNNLYLETIKYITQTDMEDYINEAILGGAW